MSEFLPVTPEQVAQQAVDAARAGAAVLHLDVRNPADGGLVRDPAALDAVVAAIRAQTDAVVATRAGADATDLHSIDMGAISHSYRRAARGISAWKYGWERPFVEGAEDRFMGSTLGEVRKVLTRLGHEARFVFECHDPSHLHNLAYCVEEGMVQAPLFVQFHFGPTGGLGSNPDNVHMMKDAADRLFGRDGYEFSVAAHGRQQIPLVALGAIMGGHVRVGLADSLYLGKGLLATSCAAQVLKIRRILEDLSLEIASADEARRILQGRGTGGSGRVAGEARLNG